MFAELKTLEWDILNTDRLTNLKIFKKEENKHYSISILRKRVDQALIPISTIQKFPALNSIVESYLILVFITGRLNDPVLNQIKSNHLFLKKNIYEFNLYKSQYVKYYFPQQADSITWSCFSWAPLLTKFFNWMITFKKKHIHKKN